MRAYPRPEVPQIDAVRTDVEGTCTECGSTDLQEYRVLSEGGWWDVRKCRTCLASLERTRAPWFGSIETLTHLLPTAKGLS